MRTLPLFCLAILGAAFITASGCNQSPTGPTTIKPPVFATPVMPPLPPGLSPALAGMLQSLPAYVTSRYQALTSSYTSNPWAFAQFEAKMALLRNPAICEEIVNGQRWAESSAPGRAGIPMLTVFPLEWMRGEAVSVLAVAAAAVPIVEDFFDAPFPTSSVRVWYGFTVGMSGGGGTLSLEDQASYLSRVADPQPFDAFVTHELGHTFMASEPLDQFLELYLYNMVHGAPEDPGAWTFTRKWVPDQDANTGVSALLDVYKLIGPDLMRRAYRAIRPLKPAYGQPISEAVIQAFLAELPEGLRPAVEAKLRRVG